MFTCIFHKKRSAYKFSCKKKCSKCGTMASCEYYFVEQIARTTHHRNMIDPRYKVEKLVLTDCGYILQILITSPSLITACFSKFIEKLDVILGHVTKFHKY